MYPKWHIYILVGSHPPHPDKMAFPKTFDTFLPSNKDLFGLAKIKPDYVSLETLRSVPLDPAHAASLEYARKIMPHEVFLHSIRCYYFALAILRNGFPSETRAPADHLRGAQPAELPPTWAGRPLPRATRTSPPG
ncbi:hypothetical protein K438DRAFT_1973645 [Mycena galopus ATCC 62051]|nr:hypothetical protein K438DRAFT_1765578 [Mycena galopus ATCC 62051]KAF8185795.1 hypothetical protein K438DRAFT_1973645 [Mycena galopus ATCC 62051]